MLYRCNDMATVGIKGLKNNAKTHVKEMKHFKDTTDWIKTEVKPCSGGS